MSKILILFQFLATLGLNAADTRPNIIFMMADDQGWDGLSCAMHPQIKASQNAVIQTPNIARLAREGMRFSQAYAPSPVCAATRIALQTGKSPAALHWTKAAKSISASANCKLLPPTNIRNISEKETTIAETLSKAGYLTAHYGKWHVNGGGPGKHGYHEHDGDIGNEYAANFPDPNPADVFGMAKRADKFMSKAKQQRKPFFIFMAFHALHAPQNALKATRAKYEKLMPKGKDKELGRAAMAENLDTAVGRVLASVKKLGLEKNTIVIYTSDNGSGGKRGPLAGGKGDLWEGGIRIPLIVRGPGIAAKSWCSTAVNLIDFFPSYCRWAKVKNLPTGLEGGDLTSLLTRKGRGIVKRSRPGLFFHFPHYQGDTPHSSYLLGDWKLIKFYETGALKLYNLKDDIGEKRDLSQQQIERTRSMSFALEKYLSEVKAQLPQMNPDYDPSKPSNPREGKGNKGGKKKEKNKKKKNNKRTEEN